MKKLVNRAKVADGFGATLIGDVGSSPADSDPKCVALPDLPPHTEHIEL